MKSFQEFISEVNRPNQGSEEEQRRWDRVRKALDARDNSDEFYIAALGRDENGIQRYGTKRRDAKRNQLTNRESRIKFVDSFLDPNDPKSNRGSVKGETIASRGFETHHGTSISQSAREFAGKTREEIKAQIEKDAQFGKFHGNDRRNLIQTVGPGGGKGIPHRGTGGYHSERKPVGTGGSIQNLGSEQETVSIGRRRESSIRKTGMSPLDKLCAEKGIPPSKCHPRTLQSKQTPEERLERDARMYLRARKNKLPDNG